MKARAWLLALLTCLLLSASALAAGSTDTWSDPGNYTAPTNFNSTTKEITVTTAAELGWVSAMVANGQTFAGYNIYLGADIDLSGHLWLPIGSWNSNGLRASTYFSGTFDGQLHSVKNMTVKPGLTSSGLFGCIAGATVKNLLIVDCLVSGDTGFNSCTGGLVAWARSEIGVNAIRGCGVSGAVAGGYYTGGIVGGSNIGCCCYVFSSYADCTVKGQSNDYALGRTAVFYNCWYNADKCANAANNTDEYDAAVLYDCYGITGASLVSTDFVALLNGVLMEDVPDWTAGEGGWPTFTGTYTRSWWNNAIPVVEQDGIYYIRTAGELAYIARLVNGGDTLAGKTVKLMADIDLGAKCWTPIGADGEYDGAYFGGNFDGNGKVIRNMTITPDVHHDIGLFGYTKEGSFKNVTIQSPVIHLLDSVWYCGCVVAETFDAEISNCHVTDCRIDSSNADGCVGGIAAYMHGTSALTDCSVTGEIISSGSAGGVVFIFFGESIERCSFEGTVYAGDTASGILCENIGYSLVISRCYAAGTVSGNTLAAGIMAGSRYNYNSTSIEDCYVTAGVISNGKAGGIIGNINGEENYGPVTVTNCYATGNVSGGSDSAMLFGGGAPTVDFTTTNCYWNKNAAMTIMGLPVLTIGMGGTDTTTALTLQQMQSAANFSGFDFSGVWAISADKNGGLPYLRWQTNVPAVVKPTAMSLNTTALTVNEGSTYWLIASFAPVNAGGDVAWTSSDPAVVTVSAGLVTAHRTGSATITATCGNLTATCAVTVTARPFNAYTLGQPKLTGTDGREVGEIPKTSFWVTVPLTKNEANDDAVVVIAAYSASGAYQGMFVMRGGVSVGATAEFGVLINNSDGRIANIKAFALSSLSEPTPLCASVPAQ